MIGILDDCPRRNQCCLCIPLNVGVYFIVGVGLLLSVIYMHQATDRVVINNRSYVTVTTKFEYVGLLIARSLNLSIAIIVFVIHIVLLFGLITRMDIIFDIYLWTMTVVVALAAHVLLGTAMMFYMGDKLPVYYRVGYVVTSSIPLYTFVYFITVVGYYRQIVFSSPSE